MSTQSNIKDRFKKILTSKTKEERLKRDAYILMASYLSEIERLYSDKGFNRKELANEISISPSYLTQVFTGHKPLNFITLAKIKNALDIRFEVTASFNEEKKTAVTSEIAYYKGDVYTMSIPHHGTTFGDGLSSKFIMGESLSIPQIQEPSLQSA